MFHQAINSSKHLVALNPFSALFDQLHIGVCLLDQTASILFENKEFQRQRDTLQIFGAGYQRHFISRDEHLRSNLHDLFSAVTSSFAIAIPIAGDRSECLLVVEGLSLQGPAVGAKSWGYALIIRDTSNRFRVSPKLVRQAFGLTDAEAQVTLLVCDGLTNNEIAEHRGRSIDTVNAQLKSVLRKTLSANRTDLVIKVGGLSV